MVKTVFVIIIEILNGLRILNLVFSTFFYFMNIFVYFWLFLRPGVVLNSSAFCALNFFMFYFIIGSRYINRDFYDASENNSRLKIWQRYDCVINGWLAYILRLVSLQFSPSLYIDVFQCCSLNYIYGWNWRPSMALIETVYYGSGRKIWSSDLCRQLFYWPVFMWFVSCRS